MDQRAKYIDLKSESRAAIEPQLMLSPTMLNYGDTPKGRTKSRTLTVTANIAIKITVSCNSQSIQMQSVNFEAGEKPVTLTLRLRSDNLQYGNFNAVVTFSDNNNVVLKSLQITAKITEEINVLNDVETYETPTNNNNNYSSPSIRFNIDQTIDGIASAFNVPRPIAKLIIILTLSISILSFPMFFHSGNKKESPSNNKTIVKQQIIKSYNGVVPIVKPTNKPASNEEKIPVMVYAYPWAYVKITNVSDKTEIKAVASFVSPVKLTGCAIYTFSLTHPSYPELNERIFIYGDEGYIIEADMEKGSIAWKKNESK